jgi:hypothetical protein
MRLVAAVAGAVMLICLGALSVSTLFGVIVVGVAPAAAQQGSLHDSFQRFDKLYHTGNYAAALAEAHKTEVLAKAYLVSLTPTTLTPSSTWPTCTTR